MSSLLQVYFLSGTGKHIRRVPAINRPAEQIAGREMGHHHGVFIAHEGDADFRRIQVCPAGTKRRGLQHQPAALQLPVRLMPQRLRAQKWAFMAKCAG